MEVIIAALIAGASAAAKDTVGNAIKDSYSGLKTLIQGKFKDDALGKAMVDAKPEEIKQTEGLLKTKIMEAGVDKDEEITKLAEKLLETLQKEDKDGLATGKYGITVKGDIKGIVGDISGGTINQTIS
ncbi:MAG: hypothetical protein AB4041_18580 [Microcystaceae cyanobacterium]